MSDSLPPADLSGQTIGDFQVLRKLGQGGMGQVYLAKQLSLKRDVALKILKSELASNPTALLRFRQEAEAVARISHPNIVQVYAVGEQAGLHYMALEYVDGRNLRDYLARKGPPELPIALSILKQVSQALLKAHELGLVHRDIKPENILVTRKVQVKVADFGLSRFFTGEAASVNLTQSGVTLGTPLYMSPEQVRGEATDHRSDLYSLGVTAFHLLAGEPPFHGKTPFEVSVQHVQKEPPSLSSFRPDLPPELCALVHGLMAKRVAERYQSARDVIRDLGKVREGLAVGATQMAVPGGLLSMERSAVLPQSSTMQFEPVRWGVDLKRWAIGTVGVVALSLLSFGALRLTAARSPQSTSATAKSHSLPLPSTAELDLKAKIESRQTPAEESLAAAIRLGLLYIDERRWGDSENLFREMESERFYRGGSRPLEVAALIVAGKLGHGVALSHQNRAKESNALIAEAITSSARLRLPGEAAPKAGRSTAGAMAQQFFLRHPALSQAVAEAVTRNGENGERDSRLDWLRTPGSLIKGP
jgi:serine/threonine-protein kinase